MSGLNSDHIHPGSWNCSSHGLDLGLGILRVDSLRLDIQPLRSQTAVRYIDRIGCRRIPDADVPADRGHSSRFAHSSSADNLVAEHVLSRNDSGGFRGGEVGDPGRSSQIPVLGEPSQKASPERLHLMGA